MERCVRFLGRSRISLLPLLTQRNISTTRVIAAGYWNKDWKPGPYPTTPDEREAAAKKYGLRVEDYDVYDHDGMGYGDYPKLPTISGDSKDPYIDYDIPELKRNYGEPLHVDADMIGEDRLDLTTVRRVPDSQALKWFLSVVTTFVVLALLSQPYVYLQSRMPKQYPYNDLHVEKGGDPANMPVVKHYTFEPAH